MLFSFNFQNETKFEKQNFLQRKDENLKLPSTSTDNLLVLKRIGEIKEAPEYQAKKKHDAQIQMRKMREFRKMQTKKMSVPKAHQIKNLISETRRLTTNKVLQECTQSQLPSDIVVSKIGNKGIMQDTQQPEEKNKVLPDTAVQTIKQRNIVQKVPQLQLRNLSPLKDQKRQKQLQTLEKIMPIKINEVQSLPQSGNKLDNKMLQRHVHVSQQSQRRKFRVLSAAELETIQKKQKAKVVGSPGSQVKKVRVLSQAEIEKFQKIPNSQIKNIQVYSKDQLSRTQENLQFLLINDEMGLQSENQEECIQSKQTLLYQSLSTDGDEIIQNNKTHEKNQHNITMDNSENMGCKTQKSLNDNIFSVDIIDTSLEKQNISERFTEIGKLMNDTIEYVDQVMKSLDKTSCKTDVSCFIFKFNICHC